jgi:hypothetical protein
MVTMERNPNPQFSKVHLTTLNFNNFKTILAMGLKLLHRGPLQWHYLRNKFHENLPGGLEVISGRPTYVQTQTHRQTERLVI